MATNRERQNAKYKAWQLEAARFGVEAFEFDLRVCTFLNQRVQFLHNERVPTPAEWARAAATIGNEITQGR